MPEYVGDAFEWIARQWVEHYAAELLPAPAREYGKIWSANFDIDVVGTLLDDTVVFGECKWSSRAVGTNI